ncbi:DUF1643 domain-containing protein [Microvirga sp. TS319]|uniref:DUF1643 domain-containing protein n=1 Tax=Microvirga sp. TS319 TaxID=3241165 RepID=UPI00351A8E15
MSDLFNASSAIISECGLYRYRLERGDRHGTKSVAFIMINPSTADAAQDDATIRKCRGFAQQHGFGHLIVGNLFAYRATDVKELRNAFDAVGPDNDDHLWQILRDADTVIVAWGPASKVPQSLRSRWDRVPAMAQLVGKPLHCLGVAKNGHPRHPLMTPYSMPLTPWKAP